MGSHRFAPRAGWAALLLGIAAAGGCVPDGGLWSQVIPEQRHLDVRDPPQLPRTPLAAVPPPPTVSAPPAPAAPADLSLDEAIRIALANSKVVRFLAGVTVTPSGRTIYDPAISNTFIDQERGAFDPTVTVRNSFNRIEQPQAFLDPGNPTGTTIGGTRVDEYSLGATLSKKTITGGTASLDITDRVDRFNLGPSPFNFFPLNPQETSAVTLSYTQPLLQGAGVGPNLAPIMIARINTEVSYFQYKDSVQELVRGVVEAYWAIVFARTDVWARRQQVEQGRENYERLQARFPRLASSADVAQARLALANFRAQLVASEANLLQREAALRNLLYLSPSEPDRIIPKTPPTAARLDPKWEEIVQLAEEYRPDLIELQLILEADRQMLLQARNQALPRVDATMLYRWNGLEGETPRGVHVATGAGQFTDWTLGVNFSVPLGLRAGRAALRRSELILARDQANLEQGKHNALNALAGSYRNLAQFYEQYRVNRDAREAARLNLDQQLAAYAAGRTIFLNVLQAITDWGNAVSAEAQSLTQYNTELANLERQTGTILETHGIRFSEERYGSIGPLGRLAKKVCYPSDVVPGPNADRYPVQQKPAEEFFELTTPRISGQTAPPPVRPLPEGAPLLPRPTPLVPERPPFGGK
jgi:outer membrane protein TolC